MPVTGILPVIPTPFLDGEFDKDSFRRLLDHMLPFVDGYTLLGSTGESPSLLSHERRQIVETALEMTPKDKRVVVGVGDTSARESAAMARHAQDHGASAVLCPAPYYYGNSSPGILRYLSEVDAAISIDLVLYDNPVVTSTAIGAEEVLGWARELKHLTAVKLTDHDLGKVDVWRKGGLNVLAGDDVILLRYLARDVDGAMVIAPAVFPEAFHETWSLFKKGDTERALRVAGARMLSFLHVFGVGDEIPATKAILKEMGVFASDELFAPLMPVSDEWRSLLRSSYEACSRADLEAKGA